MNPQIDPDLVSKLVDRGKNELLGPSFTSPDITQSPSVQGSMTYPTPKQGISLNTNPNFPPSPPIPQSPSTSPLQMLSKPQPNQSSIQNSGPAFPNPTIPPKTGPYNPSGIIGALAQAVSNVGAGLAHHDIGENDKYFEDLRNRPYQQAMKNITLQNQGMETDPNSDLSKSFRQIGQKYGLNIPETMPASATKQLIGPAYDYMLGEARMDMANARTMAAYGRNENASQAGARAKPVPEQLVQPLNNYHDADQALEDLKDHPQMGKEWFQHGDFDEKAKQAYLMAGKALGLSDKELATFVKSIPSGKSAKDAANDISGIQQNLRDRKNSTLQTLSADYNVAPFQSLNLNPSKYSATTLPKGLHNEAAQYAGVKR